MTTTKGVSDADRQRMALDRVCDEFGLSYAELARMAKLKRPNLLYNFRKGRSSSLSKETISSIVAALPGITFEHLLDPDLPIQAPDVVEPDIPEAILIKGRVHHGVFSAAEYPPRQQQIIGYPGIGPTPPGFHALEVVDAGGLYEPGDLLLCVPLIAWRQELSQGLAVVTHRYSRGGIEVAVWSCTMTEGDVLLENPTERVVLPHGYRGGPFDVEEDRMEVVSVVTGHRLMLGQAVA